MPAIKYLERIQRIDQLIRQKATGNPKQLAEKVGVSERHLYVMLNEMKDLGAPINFNFDRNSYVYSKDLRFEYGFIKNECL